MDAEPEIYLHDNRELVARFKSLETGFAQLRTWKSQHNHAGILYPPEGTSAKYNAPKSLQIKLNGIKNLLTCKHPAKATHMDDQ
jgi:hypothetical protein